MLLTLEAHTCAPNFASASNGRPRLVAGAIGGWLAGVVSVVFKVKLGHNGDGQDKGTRNTEI